MEKISDRLIKIINLEEISVRSLEQRIGCSNGVLSKFMRSGTDIGSTWVAKIIEIFPKYSAEWFLTGNGNMLKSENYATSRDFICDDLELLHDEATDCEKCMVKDDLIKSLREQIELQSKLISHLEKQNKTG